MVTRALWHSWSESQESNLPSPGPKPGGSPTTLDSVVAEPGIAPGTVDYESSVILFHHSATSRPGWSRTTSCVLIRHVR